MNDQIKLIIEYKKNENNYTFEEIVFSFKPLILKYMKKVLKYYWEDIYQELLFGLFLAINKFIIVDYKFNFKWIKKFKEKYSTLLCRKTKEMFKYEYVLFCNENQFIRYLNKSLSNIVSDFYRDYKEEFSVTIVSLNDLIYENLELIDVIPDTTYEKNSLFDKYSFTDKEINFINTFIEDRKVISEDKVAKKLGISQQAVNKKKTKIINKYLKSKNIFIRGCYFNTFLRVI